MSTGINAQIGYVAESTYGTGAVVTRFIPLVSESLSNEIEAVESAGILAGRHVMTSQQWAQGNKTISGDIQHELYDQSLGLLLRAAFGTVTTTAAGGGTAVHTFFPATPSVSLTTQIGRPTTYGSVIPCTYTGVKVQSWELAMEAGAIATWGMTVAGQDEFLGTALAAVSYATNLRPWVFKSAVISVDGTACPVKSYSISGENNLTDDRRYVGSTLIGEPLRGDLLNVTGELTAEWGTPSTMGTMNYDRFIRGTESTLIATLTSGTLNGTIQANVRYDGSTPQVSGRGIVEHSIPFKAVASGSLDSHAITVSIRNNDATA